MSLVQIKLDKSVNQSRGIFDKYVYSPGNGDSSSDVVEVDYWIESRFIDDPEWDGSVIEMKLADGYFVGIVSGGNMPVIYQVGGGQSEVSIIAYADYITKPAQLLTTTPTIVTGWVNDIDPVNISEDNGRLTIDEDGVFKFDLERIYQNVDNNPDEAVFITLDIRKNGATVAPRTAPIASATSPQEPSIDTFTTPFLEVASKGDYYEVYVSAEDNGNNPVGTTLELMKIVIDRSHDTPI